MPKTGGTFVAECMKQLNHSGKLREPQRGFWRRWLCRDNFHKVPDVSKHGCVSDISKEYQNLPIVGCIRSPEAWYSSNYRFAWWHRFPEKFPGVLECPAFPNLSFDDYFRLSNTTWIEAEFPYLTPPYPAGRYTLLLLKWFSRDAKAFLEKINGKITCEHLVEELGEIIWLNCERLNTDLHQLLRRFDWAENELNFILDQPPVLPTTDPRNNGSGIQHLISDEESALIQATDVAVYQFIEYLRTRNKR